MTSEITSTPKKRRPRPPPALATRLAIGEKNATRACAFSDWLRSSQQTATSWALAHVDDETRPRWAPSAVRAWMMSGGKSARAVPEAAAKLIEQESEGAVPAVDSAWPNGISRPRRQSAS